MFLLLICFQYRAAIEKPVELGFKEVRSHTNPWREPINSTQVEIGGDKLYLDGEPFFSFGFCHWYSPMEEPYFDEAKKRGVNTVVFHVHPTEESLSEFTEFLQWAEAKDIMVVPWFTPYLEESQGRPSWSDEWVSRFLQFKDSPAILAWNLADDAFVRKGMDMYLHYFDLVKTLDPDHPLFLVDMELRQARDSFLPYVDIAYAYLYPLFRDGEARPAYSTYEGRLEDQQLLVERMKAAMKEAEKVMPMWTVIQAHTQDDWNKIGLPAEKRGYPPEPEQIRLLTYMSISRGVRGIHYFQPRFLTEEMHGRDRYAEIGIIGLELKLFGDMIAGGYLVTGTTVNHTEVEAARVSYGDNELVILVKHGKNYQLYVDEGVVKNVRVRVPHSGAEDLLAYKVSFPETEQLEFEVVENQTIEFILQRLELTDFIILTHDQGLLSKIEARMTELLPNVASLAVEAAEKKGHKVASVANELMQMGWNPKNVDSLLAEREENLSLAKNLLTKGDYKGAYTSARRSQLLCREIEAKYMEYAQQHREKAGEAKKYFLSYYLLPDYLIYLRQQRAWHVLLSSLTFAGIATVVAIILKRKKRRYQAS